MATKTKTKPIVEQFCIQGNPKNGKWFIWRDVNGIVEYMDNEGKWKHTCSAFFNSKAEAEAAIQNEN